MTGADESARPAADIRILSGDPTPEELAAVTAVLAAALDQLAAEHRRRDSATSGWERSVRAPRAALTPGAWSTFGR